MASKVSSNSVEEPGSFNMEEKITSLFEPDTLVSAQYFQNFRGKTCLEPEKRLILAMLDLLSDLSHGAKGKRKKAVQRGGGVDHDKARRLDFFVCERL